MVFGRIRFFGMLTKEIRVLPCARTGCWSCWCCCCCCAGAGADGDDCPWLYNIIQLVPKVFKDATLKYQKHYSRRHDWRPFPFVPGQAPHTAVIGCADSRAPVESIFDALPGDIFVLRNAGNTCTHAEGAFRRCNGVSRNHAQNIPKSIIATEFTCLYSMASLGWRYVQLGSTRVLFVQEQPIGLSVQVEGTGPCYWYPVSRFALLDPIASQASHPRFVFFIMFWASRFMASKILQESETCSHPWLAPLVSGSMIGSLEFCIGKLKSRLVVVLGHTKCGAIYGATKEIWLQPQTQAKGIKYDQLWSIDILPIL